MKQNTEYKKWQGVVALKSYILLDCIINSVAVQRLHWLEESNEDST